MAATRLGAFSSCCCPVVGRARAVVCGLGAIGGSAISISLRPQENVLEARAGVVLEIVQARQLVTAFGAAVAQGGGSIAVVRRLEPYRGRLVAHRRHEVAVARRPLARADAPVVRGRVATGRKIVVRGMLILVSAPLVAIAGRLVVIRPGLVLVARRLIGVTRVLIDPGGGIIGVASQQLARDLSPARPTDDDRGRLTAGRTANSLRHFGLLLAPDKARLRSTVALFVARRATGGRAREG